MAKNKTKYDEGDVLMTKMGKIFIIKNILMKGSKWYYKLKNHYHPMLPVDYVDNSHHILPATKAAKVLYGFKKT